MQHKALIHRTLLAVAFSCLATAVGHTQSPVFTPPIDIDQQLLLKGCLIATNSTCHYSLKDVLNSGGDFWTTPFQPYDPVTKTGDGYGEGANGPRAAQRHFFNPHNPNYPYLRLNGLDSQSCFECHNSTGSHIIDARGAQIRNPYGVAGSAGSNSNAFINPLYPKQATLFIRNPPAVFGSGYQQAVGDEMTFELFMERDYARTQAKLTPGKPYSQALTAKGIPFGTFITTYTNRPAIVLADIAICKAGVIHPLFIGGETGFTDDVRQLQGVSCDLVIRPMQWKGVASSLRHFVRDALDFHFSMQAFEKVGKCDCDMDGKGTPETGPEVTIGQVSAMVSFVAMTRPPVQLALTTPSQHRGQQIFVGDPAVAGLYKNMCEQCHVAPLKLVTPNVLVEWPTNSTNETAGGVDPDDPSSWPILPASCVNGIPADPGVCPSESSYGASKSSSKTSSANRGALVSPAISSLQLSVVKRYQANKLALEAQPALKAEALNAADQLDANLRRLRAPLSPQRVRAFGNAKLLTASADSVVGQDYVIPLSAPASQLTSTQLPRLPSNPDGSIQVPLFSDLKRHNMGKQLTDPEAPLPTQGTDVTDINNVAGEFMTRPIWGVADTGPWLHDGRALTLKDAILMHGNSKTNSEAGPVIDAFEKLSDADKNAVVDFLLTLRLPPPNNIEPPN